jgi:hypothetical protein
MSNDEYPSKSGWPLYLWIASGLIPALVMIVWPMTFIASYSGGSDEPIMGLFYLSMLLASFLTGLYTWIWSKAFRRSTAVLDSTIGGSGSALSMWLINHLLAVAGCGIGCGIAGSIGA